jgi:putative transposase
MRIREIAQARVRYGYRKIRMLLNREAWDMGKYLVYRPCKEKGLMLKRMKPASKRKAARLREEKIKPAIPDQAWSMDFVADQLQDGTQAGTAVRMHPISDTRATSMRFSQTRKLPCTATPFRGSG